MARQPGEEVLEGAGSKGQAGLAQGGFNLLAREGLARGLA